MLRSLILPFLTLALGAPLAALGASEDPGETLTKVWTLGRLRSLEIRGEVKFTMVEGAQTRITVTTSRALFDQLTVSDWWGSATVAIESGLRGPREQGEVLVTVETPALEEISVLDHSSGQISWPPGTKARVRVGENSLVNLEVDGQALTAEASWYSTIRFKGRAEGLTASLRHQSQLDARDLAVGVIRVDLDESTLEAAPGSLGLGTGRHRSRVTTPQPQQWTGLELREGSVLERRADQ